MQETPAVNRKSPGMMLLIMLGIVVLGGLALYALLRQPQLFSDVNPPRYVMSDEAEADIVVGLVPEQDIFSQRKRYRALLDHVGSQIGVKIAVRSLPTYGAVIRALEDRSIDAAFVGSLAYALAHDRADVAVLARPVWKDGSSTYCSYIFARADSGVRTVADMKGKRLALVDRSTTAGFMFPLAHFRDHGVDDIHSFFSKVYMAGSHDAAGLAVLEGQADVGAAKNHPIDRLLSQHQEWRDKIVILARSADVPSNGLVVNSQVPAKLRDQLKSGLLGLTQTADGRAVLETFGARKFIATAHADYATLYAMISKAGVDLASYQLEDDPTPSR